MNGSRPIDHGPGWRWPLIAVAVAAATLLAAASGALSGADRILYDLGLRLSSRPAPADILIVGIDDPSLAEYGHWPWPRDLQARLIRTLGGARGVLYDVLLSEPDATDPGADLALADAIRENGRVALPLIHVLGPGGANEALLPMPVLRAAAATIGHVQLEIDPDGIARSVYLYEGPGNALWPQIGLALLQVVAPQRAFALPRSQAPTPLPGLWVRDRHLRIPFLGPRGHVAQVSAARVLHGEIPPGQWQGKLVLVGAVAQGLGDSYPTPVSGGTRSMPGVEVTANVVAALDAGTLITEVPSLPAAAAAGALVLALAWIFPRVSSRTALLAAIAVVAGVLGATLVGLRFGNVWFPPAAGAAGVALAFGAWDLHQVARANAFVDQELARLRQERRLFAPAIDAAESAGEVRSDRLGQRMAAVQVAARQVEAAQRFVVQVIAQLPIGVFVTDGSGQVVLANARARAVFPGVADRLPTPLAGILASRLTEPPLWTTAQEDGVPLQRCEVRTAAGLTLLLVRGPGADAGGELITVTDITDLRQADRQREELLRFLSHDMRSPQASILALLDMSASRGDGLDPDERLARIGTYARRTLALADDFVNIARAESLAPTALRDVDLAEIAHEASDEAWALATGKHVRVERRIADEARVHGDIALLRRALFNLLDNAIKYSPADAVVDIELARDGDDWCCSVRDRGAGIAPELLPRLFHRFERADSGSRGVGLGLVLARTVAQRLGGDLTVASTLGEGSIFTLRIPAATSA